VCVEFLAAHANTVCTSSQIVSQVWGYNDAGDTGLVKSHIRHLRQKIEPNPAQPIYLLTVPEGGYMLVNHDKDEAKE
jgi:DNA-binding response OmpR family regulator